MEIKDFLEEQESIGNKLVNVRQWATEKADEKFGKEYQDTMKWNELYYLPNPEHRPDEWALKEEYNDIYWGMVDEFENELLEYQSELYE